MECLKPDNLVGDGVLPSHQVVNQSPEHPSYYLSRNGLVIPYELEGLDLRALDVQLALFHPVDETHHFFDGQVHWKVLILPRYPVELGHLLDLDVSADIAPF